MPPLYDLVGVAVARTHEAALLSARSAVAGWGSCSFSACGRDTAVLLERRETRPSRERHPPVWSMVRRERGLAQVRGRARKPGETRAAASSFHRQTNHPTPDSVSEPRALRGARWKA